MSPDVPSRVPLARLFSPVSAEAVKALAEYPVLLRRALALRPGMERELPRRVAELSLSLTADREGGPRPGYLSDPRCLAAYAWYFLPWNLVRLCRLLPGLDLDLPEDGLVCDLGAGPLTLMQALWLSRPDLRRKRLRFVCVDRSRRALDLGAGLFAGLAGFDPQSPEAPWRVRLVRGEYWQGLADGASLVALVNVANEMSGPGREPLAERMDRLAGQLADALAKDGRLLVVEPGTRLGWRCLEGLRRALLEMGLGLLGPCPHDRDCPLAGGKVRAWCHFVTGAAGAPGWLSALSDRAGLAKDRLSLSYLLARAGEGAGQPGAARVVSGAFALSDRPGSAVYGCHQSGLLVLCAPDRRPPGSGDLLEVTVPKDAPLDGKSGAPRLILPVDPARPAPPRDGDRPPAPGRDAPGQSRPRPRTGKAAPGQPTQAPRAGRPGPPARSGQGGAPAGKGKPAGPARTRGPARPRAGKGPRSGPRVVPARDLE